MAENNIPTNEQNQSPSNDNFGNASEKSNQSKRNLIWLILMPVVIAVWAFWRLNYSPDNLIYYNESVLVKMVESVGFILLIITVLLFLYLNSSQFGRLVKQQKTYIGIASLGVFVVIIATFINTATGIDKIPEASIFIVPLLYLLGIVPIYIGLFYSRPKFLLANGLEKKTIRYLNGKIALYIALFLFFYSYIFDSMARCVHLSCIPLVFVAVLIVILVIYGIIALLIGKKAT